MLPKTTTIPCAKTTRREFAALRKRLGMTSDGLLRRLLAQLGETQSRGHATQTPSSGDTGECDEKRGQKPELNGRNQTAAA